MIRRAPLAIVLLASACGSASADSVPPGIYSSVTSSEATGDLAGAELELIGTGAEARVEFVVCEGWCNIIHRAPVKFTPTGFTFSYVENYAAGDGAPASGQAFDVAAERKGAGLTLRVTPAGSPGSSLGYDLEPVDKRFGLSATAEEH